MSAEAIRAAILELHRAKATIVLSTHDMATAEHMCERILMLYHGRKVLDGSLLEIQDRFGTDTIQVCADNGAAACLNGLPGIEQIRDLGQKQEIRLAAHGDPQTLLRALMTHARIQSFCITKPSLEDIFIRIAGEDATTESLEVTSA